MRGRTRISGVLDDDGLADLSLEGQTIRIIGKNRTYVAKTDKNVPANDESLLACNSLTDELGRFQIDSIEAGTYIIIFNYENKITTRTPFPKLYYPGVPEREKAKRITLKHGESANDLNVVIKF